MWKESFKSTPCHGLEQDYVVMNTPLNIARVLELVHLCMYYTMVNSTFFDVKLKLNRPSLHLSYFSKIKNIFDKFLDTLTHAYRGWISHKHFFFESVERIFFKLWSKLKNNISFLSSRFSWWQFEKLTTLEKCLIPWPRWLLFDGITMNGDI